MGIGRRIYGDDSDRRASASVPEIVSTVADRFSLETEFCDCKEIVGAGQQQVRFVWGNIGAFHICLWTFTMTEAWHRTGRRTNWWTAGHYGSESAMPHPPVVAMGQSEPSPKPRRQTSGVEP